ncbi:hypothetical protein C8R44DRAFT_976680 [Mycena epipterygia]|nr:hypothetical protein C8R44DRAFT_976680 [Mycena epipterygia]
MPASRQHLPEAQDTFPPGSSPTLAPPQIAPSELVAQREEEAEHQRQVALDDAYATHLVLDAALRKARLEGEAAEARKDATDWVRSSGILRMPKEIGNT